MRYLRTRRRMNSKNCSIVVDSNAIQLFVPTRADFLLEHEKMLLSFYSNLYTLASPWKRTTEFVFLQVRAVRSSEVIYLVTHICILQADLSRTI